MRDFFVAAVASLLFPLNVATASGGGASGAGNGADLIRIEDGSAWFLNEQAIPYCIRARNFPISEDELHRKIEWAYRTWQSYYDLKKVGVDIRPTRISFKTDYRKQCAPGTGITFYFGETSASVEAVRSYYSDPLAFERRLSYDPVQGTSKGFVWVSLSKEVNWRQNHALEAVLLHEVGHLLGVGHIRGTIMSEKIAELIVQNKLGADALEIDHATELKYFPRWHDYAGSISKYKSNSERNFEMLVGRKPVGAIRAVLRAQVTRSVEPWTLILSDDLGEIQIPFVLNIHSYAETNFPLHSFKVATRNPRTGQVEVKSADTVSAQLMGTIQTPSGKVFDGILKYNMLYDEEPSLADDLTRDEELKRVPFQISFLSDHQLYRLFGPSGYWVGKDW